ncbi:MAG: TetR/AcrR family transcriptional regulator [Acidobacteriota bacterium]|nr:MAG: TetR/AcrR family transcriptional regulator [Acidobacteriota bacterium]
MKTKTARKRKPGRPRDEALAERRQEEILETATSVFAELGYRATDVQVIADRLGVGKGTVYRYFSSKRKLFLAAVDRGMLMLRQEADASSEGVADPLERVAKAIQTYLSFFDSHPQFVELLMQERAEFKDRKKPTYFQHYDANLGPWKKLFRGLMAEGRVRKVPVDRIIDVISDLLYGTIFTNYFAGRRKSFNVQARDVIDVVFHGILGEGERRRRGPRSAVAATRRRERPSVPEGSRMR